MDDALAACAPAELALTAPELPPAARCCAANGDSAAVYAPVDGVIVGTEAVAAAASGSDGKERRCVTGGSADVAAVDSSRADSAPECVRRSCSANNCLGTTAMYHVQQTVNENK